MSGFRTRLVHARKKVRRLSQVKLAKLAGITQPSLSELETGETKEVSGPTLIGLAKGLGVRPEWLMDGDEPMEQPLAESVLKDDEKQLLASYRQATAGWKLTLRLLARLHPEQHEEVSSSVNVLLAKVAADPVPDSRLGNEWTRPDKRKKS